MNSLEGENLQGVELCTSPGWPMNIDLKDPERSEENACFVIDTDVVLHQVGI